MKVVGIIQARMGSKRLPEKSMRTLCGKPLLYYVIHRVKMAETLDTVVLATSANSENDVLENLARDLDIEVYRGSEEDVLGRFVEAAQAFNSDVIVRVCADNPLIAPGEIDRIVRHHIESNVDYSFNHVPRKGNNYPDGLGAEVIDFMVLKKIANTAQSPYHREHVTTYIWENSNEFSIETMQAPPEIAGPDIKLDVDTEEDLRKIELFMGSLPPELRPAWSAKLIVGIYRDHFKTKTLVLLEHEEQVKNCLKWFDEIKGQKIIIALSPFAMYELDKHNIPYRIPEDYYEPKELYQMCSDNFKRIKELCGIIDDCVQKALPVLKKLGISPALFSIFSLKIIYDATAIRLFQLLKIIKTEEPNVVFVYDSKDYPFENNKGIYLIFDNRESIYARLLKLQGWKKPVVMFPLVSEPGSSSTKTDKYIKIFKLKNKIFRWMWNNPQLYDFVTALRTRGMKGFINKINLYIRGDMPVLLLGGYDWNECDEDFNFVRIGPILKMPTYQEDFLIEPNTPEIQQKDLSTAWEKLRMDVEFRQFFIFGGVDFFNLLKDRFQYLIEVLPVTSYNAYYETGRVLKKKKIRAVLTSTFTTCVDHSISRAARDLCVPVINWQHGSYGYYEHLTMAYIDTVSSDFHLVWGDQVAKHITKTVKELKTQLIPVGSTILDNLHREAYLNTAKGSLKSNSEKKVILYAITNLYQNVGYVSFFPPFSDNHFWQTQEAILDVLGRHSGYNVIIKFHPVTFCRDPPMRLLARKNEFKHFRFVKYTPPYVDLLPKTDVIVLDFPSTTLLQSLTTSKPIFVYTGHLQLDDDMLTLLKRRAYCYKELKDLLQDLDTFLKHGEIDAKVDLNDKEFLKACGMYQLDGKSGSRVAHVVKKVIMRTGREG